MVYVRVCVEVYGRPLEGTQRRLNTVPRAEMFAITPGVNHEHVARNATIHTNADAHANADA